MKFPALYRRYHEAPIVATEYVIATQSMFDLKFPLPYDYVEEFSITLDKVDDFKISAMYKAFLERKEILAVVLINNAYLSMLYPDKVYTIKLSDDEDNQENNTIPSFYDYSTFAKEKVIPVGFERTFCRTYTVLVSPGRIFYNEETRAVWYKNKWCPLPASMLPKEYRKKDIYKKLVSTSEGAGILSLGDGRTQLLK